MTDADWKEVSGRITQSIPPDEHDRYAISREYAAHASGTFLTTLDTRGPPGGIWGRVKRLANWIRDPTTAVPDGVYHVMFSERPPEGEEISVEIKEVAPGLWAAWEGKPWDGDTDE